MLLRQKITLIVGVAIVAMLALNALLMMPVADSFSELEEAQALRNAARVEESFAAQLDNLTRTAWDWSHWDETYQFVAGDDPDYAAQNLSAGGMAMVDLNLMAFFDAEGRPVHALAFDLESGVPLELGRLTGGALLPDDPLLPETARFSDTRGVMGTEAGLMLFAAVPILRSEGTGPANGTLVIGRLIDDVLIAAMRSQLDIDFTVVAAGPDLETGIGAMPAVTRNADRLTVGHPLRDLTGQPVAVIQTHTTRDITRIGNQSIGVSLASLTVVGLVVIAMIWVLMQRLVLRPLARVTQAVGVIGRTGDLDGRVPVSGNDECADLGRQFNAMLDRLADAQNSLREQTGRAEMARAEAEQANESKTAFLTNMSHELRTPLNAVIGFSGLMMNGVLGPVDNPRYRGYVSDINASGQHLLALINSILDLAQASQGALELDESVFAPVEAIETALRLVSPQAEEAGINLHRIAFDARGALRADHTKVCQILTNLLSNAVKFTPAGGTVAIEAEQAPDGGLVIRVSDTGIGIAAEDLAEVMKPFGQVRNPGLRAREGTGLGLPLSATLAELHGGSLTLESTPGRGTSVTVFFPAERVVPESQEAVALLAAS